MSLPKSINNLSLALSSMPGIGPKLSNRLSLFLAVKGKRVAKSLEIALKEVQDSIVECKRCGNITTEDLCEICSDSTREQDKVLIVEDSLDLDSIESTGTYKGQYHVLNGRISPVNGIGPDDINITSLIQRAKSYEFKEIIFALNPDIEGDATSIYLRNEIQSLENVSPISFTRLAKGIPVGSDIEFMSSQTISDSLKSRTEF